MSSDHRNALNAADSPKRFRVQPTPAGARAFDAVAQRVLIIGLDGATFNVLNPLMAEGRMPNLKRVVDTGASGILKSTIPPLTPAAWTTFLTGKQPGSHGVIDFEYYEIDTGLLRFHSTLSKDHVRAIWHILGDHGFKVGSINVPMSYPPYKVNGFMVSGFETPGPDSDFVYPAELKGEILRRWPDPTLGTSWKRKVGGGDELFAGNVDYMSRSFHQGAEMTAWLGDQHGWDVLMVVLKLVDNLQHKTWKYIDPRWSGRNPARRDLVKRCFEELDKAVGSLLEYAQANQATVIMVSDHGHGSQEGKVYPNELLRRWGYLVLRPGLARLAGRARRSLGRSSATLTSGAAGGIEQHVPADLSRTRACVMHAGNAAFVYINLEGRQPTGIVKPSEYEALRDELKARFLSDECTVRNPEGKKIRLFPEVHRPEDVYNCSRQDQPWLPDLMLIQHETLAAVRKMRGRQTIRWLPYGRLEGTHRPEGIFIASGPGIVHTRDVNAQIADCVPTILAMMGLRVPDDIEGRVITEIFETSPVVEMAKAGVQAAAEPAEEAYTADELQQVTDRLADLGYLE